MIVCTYTAPWLKIGRRIAAIPWRWFGLGLLLGACIDGIVRVVA